MLNSIGLGDKISELEEVTDGDIMPATCKAIGRFFYAPWKETETLVIDALEHQVASWGKPEFAYHGTSIRTVSKIREQGFQGSKNTNMSEKRLKNFVKHMI